jgi:hypothetical protein
VCVCRHHVTNPQSTTSPNKAVLATVSKSRDGTTCITISVLRSSLHATCCSKMPGRSTMATSPRCFVNKIVFPRHRAAFNSSSCRVRVCVCVCTREKHRVCVGAVGVADSCSTKSRSHIRACVSSVRYTYICDLHAYAICMHRPAYAIRTHRPTDLCTHVRL